ncbi:MAG: bifunctional oligoribonuclease/PAP phosphatase NrnA [Halobacteriovoraceae bacterium]|nr:bifunctional oligoribonuclease/PAP phosphatase NrnA [Halobacteriovoraceae bacterium]MCB9095126.1 bifunctional oligoribonuclease/PAP phosphatase NrnA [Halobacteriovoraceae bacterium]
MGEDIYQSLKDTILKYNNIIITTHIVPDADGLGSQISLCMALRKLGKNVHCVNEEALLDRYEYLDPEKTILSLEKFLKTHKEFKTELVIIVDTNKNSRTGLKMSQFISPFANIIYIDHHPYDRKNFGQHFIDVAAAATGQIIGSLIKTLGIPFDQKLALPLYTAILIDTNTFRYPTVSSNTHTLIAELLETGIRTTKAYNDIYGAKKLHHMHLLGHILKNCQTNKDNSIAWICINKEEFDQYKTDLEDTHAYINNLLVLEEVKIACMFREEDKRIKLSLRSHGDVDVGEIAQELGGGGHAHSAATVFELPPGHDKQKIIENSIKKIEEYLINSKN